MSEPTEKPETASDTSGRASSGSSRGASRGASSAEAAAPSTSPVFPIALASGVLGLLYLVQRMPLEGDPGFWERVGLTCVVLFAAMVVYSAARTLIETVLKAMVELMAVGIFLLDALTGLLVVSYRPELEALAVDLGLGEEEAFLKMVVPIALVVFVLNAAAFLLLYPLSRIVGTHLEIK